MSTEAIQRVLRSDSAARTRAIGASIGRSMSAGLTVGLVGTLGSGKTQLVKGIAAGAGVADDKLVTSPTFSLVQEYEGRLWVHHLDTYRLAKESDLLALGFEEMLTSGGLVIVEWADRFRGAMPPESLWIELTIEGDDQRRIELRAEAGAGRRFLEQWTPDDGE